MLRFVLALAAVIAFSELLLHFLPPPSLRVDYTPRDVQRLNDLTDRVTHEKPPTLKERQAEAIAMVYGVNARNVNAYREWWK